MKRIPKTRTRPYDTTEPDKIDKVLSELFHLKGYNRFKSNEQLQKMWNEVAEDFSDSVMKVKSLRNGILEIGISNTALIYELDSYYKQEFLHVIQTKYKHLKIRDIKFRLRGNLEK